MPRPAQVTFVRQRGDGKFDVGVRFVPAAVLPRSAAA